MRGRYIYVILAVLVVLGVLLAFTEGSGTQKNTANQQGSETTVSQGQEQASSQSPKQLGSSLPFPLTVPKGFRIALFSGSVPDARDLQFSPGGTLLVSSPNTGQIFALPDADHDGTADSIKTIISGENKPHGLAFHNGKLFVAEVQKVVRYAWNERTLTATPEKTLFTLPANSDHSSRTIIFQGNTMFVSVGSTCNVCHETNPESGTIIASDAEGTKPHIFAKGLRNAPFMALQPETNSLFATEMGRDYLGDNAPPDEIDILKQGKDYGWPICYGNKIHDTQFDKKQYLVDPCAQTEAPVYEIAAHSAPLGLTFVQSTQFPDSMKGALLVAYHGSWNRTSKIGYKVVSLSVKGITVSNERDFITGFLTNGQVLGRPVDLTFDSGGNLYVSDDDAGNVYIVTKQ